MIILAAIFLFSSSQYTHAQAGRHSNRLTLKDLQLTPTQRNQLQQLIQEEKMQQLLRQKRLQLILTPEQLKKLRQSGKQHNQLFNDSLNHKNEPR
jgi:Spy/CpxP family protein refolding chaperone